MEFLGRHNIVARNINISFQNCKTEKLSQASLCRRPKLVSDLVQSSNNIALHRDTKDASTAEFLSFFLSLLCFLFFLLVRLFLLLFLHLCLFLFSFVYEETMKTKYKRFKLSFPPINAATKSGGGKKILFSVTL